MALFKVCANKVGGMQFKVIRKRLRSCYELIIKGLINDK
jgi:hypothetical protein